ncbi:MAG: hypothetical protein H8M99_13810 [Gloeobacteraceae cyanobacterium ES-bin-144]|nr:hypothetical protein [Verrucomicrobiales bacterium]
MNSRLFAALVCISLASCYPYNENALKNKKTKATEKTPPTTEVQKTAEQQAKAKADADAETKKKSEESTTSTTPAENTSATTSSTTPPSNTVKPTEQKRAEYQVANKVPGKDGFVFSPYNNKVVDVRDIPSGTLVADPTFPAADKKYFRVP